MAPKPPNARHAQAQPWRSSIVGRETTVDAEDEDEEGGGEAVAEDGVGQAEARIGGGRATCWRRSRPSGGGVCARRLMVNKVDEPRLKALVPYL